VVHILYLSKDSFTFVKKNDGIIHISIPEETTQIRGMIITAITPCCCVQRMEVHKEHPLA
jgi:hypothetical protein